MLACGHNFCLKVINKLKKHNAVYNDEFKIKCPLCKNCCIFDESPPYNYTLISIIEKLETKSKLIQPIS